MMLLKMAGQGLQIPQTVKLGVLSFAVLARSMAFNGPPSWILGVMVRWTGSGAPAKAPNGLLHGFSLSWCEMCGRPRAGFRTLVGWGVEHSG